MSSKQDGEEFLRAKSYANVGVSIKQFGFESDKKLLEPYEEKSFLKSILQALMHGKQQ